MQAFFKPGSAINPDHKEKYLHLLAYAVSGHDKPLDSDQSLEEFQHRRCYCAGTGSRLGLLPEPVMTFDPEN